MISNEFALAQENGHMSTQLFTAIIERDEDRYVALCSELDVASQGRTVEAAGTLSSIVRQSGLQRSAFDVD